MDKYKVISFYLNKNDPEYTVGAIANSLYAPIVYPGWICEYNITKNVLPEVSQRLSELPHVNVVNHNEEVGDYSRLFYRLEPLSKQNVEAVIFRECNCRLNEREKAAVDQWIDSDKNFHLMHDHSKFPFFHNGCWGAKPEGFPNIKNIILNYLASSINRPWEKLAFLNEDEKVCYKRGSYAKFMENVLYPIAEFSLMRHDDRTKNILGDKIGIPFPTEKTIESGYVGETYTVDETPQNLQDRITDVDDFAKSTMIYSESDKAEKTESMFKYGRKVSENLREARESLKDSIDN